MSLKDQQEFSPRNSISESVLMFVKFSVYVCVYLLVQNIMQRCQKFRLDLLKYSLKSLGNIALLAPTLRHINSLSSNATIHTINLPEKRSLPNQTVLKTDDTL